ncbi:aldose 1-epimerase family protein [Agrobacterium arsenijevicii]|uniref:Deoxyribose mutarotase n=1 Tax=Agrobacterium arsenijevicii TaxID=1585697 RepID=A0ABR5D272_9HYPH|nr:deoxyribose mutarotase [Agrobacterium arsenijevicii]
MQATEFHLRRQDFTDVPHLLAATDGLKVTTFRYATGIEALQLENRHGRIVILPFMGQMIWSVEFKGVDLTMGSRFSMPRPAGSIVETYGCFAFHSGMLRNGCPSPQDNHALHGEMACASMDKAGFVIGHDARGAYVRVTGEVEYVMGFGANYLARPSVTLHAEDTLFDMVMDIQNLSSAPMDLMYMCHVNFAYAEGARIVQPVPYTPERVKVRTAVPGHVTPNPDYLSLLETLAKQPSAMEVLDEPQRYNPEQVFYINGLPADGEGLTHLMMQRRDGDGFAISYPLAAFPKTVRWILVNGDSQVAAFALPSTCEPEGYLAERAKNNVQSLSPGERRAFPVRLGYLDRAAADQFGARISAL